MTSDAQTGSQGRRYFGHELGGTAERNLHPEPGQQMAVGASDAAMQDVSDNRHLQALERFLVFQNGEGIEQSLGGMFVHAIAGIDDWNIEVLRHQVRRSGGGMTNDDRVRPYRPQSVTGIE